MLRKFIACSTRWERLCFFRTTTADDWESRDLDTIMAIMGLDEYNIGLTDEQKYLTIYSHLSVTAA